MKCGTKTELITTRRKLEEKKNSEIKKYCTDKQ